MDNTLFTSYKLKIIPAVSKEHKLTDYAINKIIRQLENKDIFNPFSCCIWKGSTSKDNSYIPFYMNNKQKGNKKYTLHKLLYENYVGCTNGKYLKLVCNNRLCCNVNHIQIKKKDKVNDLVILKVKFDVIF